MCDSMRLLYHVDPRLKTSVADTHSDVLCDHPALAGLCRVGVKSRRRCRWKTKSAASGASRADRSVQVGHALLLTQTTTHRDEAGL